MSEAKSDAEQFDELLEKSPAWMSEIGKSFERGTEHIKLRIQFLDRIAVLDAALLTISLSAYAGFHQAGRVISHPNLSRSFFVAGWAFFLAGALGSAFAHYLLTEDFEIKSTQHEQQILNVLFHSLTLRQKRLATAIGLGEPLQELKTPKIGRKDEWWFAILPGYIAMFTGVSVSLAVGGAMFTFAALLFSTS